MGRSAFIFEALASTALLLSSASRCRGQRHVPFFVWIVCLVATGQAAAQPNAEPNRAIPTFADDIAPLVFSRCSTCHRPGEVGPFPLLTYEDVRRRARQIAEVTASRFMPPWKPLPNFGGPFAGSRRLSDAEVSLFARWEEAGTPAGDLNQVPALPEWPVGWQLGTPDVVVTMPESYTVSADAPDTFRNFVLPLNIDETKYVAGLEFRPDNPRVAHHANLRIDRTESSGQLDAQDPTPGYDGPISPNAQYPEGHFLGWTPGQLPPLAEPGMAWRLEPGSDLVIQLHMQSTGREESIQASVGLFFTDEPPQRTPVMVRLGRQNIDIPPGDSHYVIQDRFELPVDVELVGVQPHAHFRATEIDGFATYPDGRRESLIRISNWDFNWQDVYRYETRPVLPKGTTVSMEYVYDNSAANPRNPDNPPRRVLFGQFSNDEMGDLWLQVLARDESDRETLFNAIMPKVLNEDVVGYESALIADPNNPVLRRDTALLYMGLNRTASAIRHYARSLELDPTSATARYNLAILLAEQGSLDEAIEHLQLAVERRPNYGAAHNNLGAILLSLGRTTEAIPSLDRAVTLDADNAVARNNLGRALSLVGRSNDALPHFRQALVLDPTMADAHHNLANTLETLGDLAGAVEHQREALELVPGAIAPMTSLAWMLATAGNVELRAPSEAVTLGEEAARLTDRQNVRVLDALAAAYASAGQFDQAVTTQGVAVRLAEELGARTAAAELRRRLAMYQRREPYIGR